MAITILNTTTASVTTLGGTFIAIPATSANSTLVAAITSVGNSGSQVGSVVDNSSINTWVSATGSSLNLGGTFRGSCIFYKDLTSAGITFVIINGSGGAGTYQVVIYELAGVNHITPLEGANFLQVTDTSTLTSGSPLTTAFTNAMFIGVGIRNVSSTLGSSTNSFTRDYFINDGSSSSSIQAHKLASGTQTLACDHALGASTMIICIADFNPSPNAYTLTLSDGITSSDSLGDNTDYARSLVETITLSDIISSVLSSGARFKTLTDSLTSTDSISYVYSAGRILLDTLFLTDNVTFITNTKRLFTDSIRLQDWFSAKITTSNDWGS